MVLSSESEKNGDLSGTSSTNMKDGVEEATAALKGMLGIGTTTTTTTTSTMNNNNTDSNNSNVGIGSTPPSLPTTNKNKNSRSNKKKKTNKNKSSTSPTNPLPTDKSSEPNKTQKDHSSNDNKSNRRNKKKQPPQQQQQQQQQQSSNNSNKKTEETKFAWSAFQSSPDASRLPMPAFSSPKNTSQKTTISSVSDITTHTPTTSTSVDITVSPLLDKPNPTIANQSRQHPDSKMDTTETPSSFPAKTDVDDAPTLLPAMMTPQSKDKEGYQQSSTIDEKPISATGVNIAALSLSPKESPASHPVPIHLNMTSKYNTTTTSTSPMSLLSPQNQIAQQQQPPVPNIPNRPVPTTLMRSPPPHLPHGHHQVPYPMHSPPLPHHQHHHHPLHATPPPPPGYVTMHVQVPYQQLGPGRQMLVQTTAVNGMILPVQVTVPPNVPPGAIIPVHIPTMPIHNNNNNNMMPSPPSTTNNDTATTRAGPSLLMGPSHHSHPHSHPMVYPPPPHPNQHHNPHQHHHQHQR
jgi:hypothetical protein